MGKHTKHNTKRIGNNAKIVGGLLTAAAGISVAGAGSASAAAPGVMTSNAARNSIIMKESSGNPSAVNTLSGAKGLYQCVPRWHDCPELGDIADQHAWGEKYMLDRYGSWSKALAFHEANGWW